MSIFKKYLDGDITAKEAKLEYLIGKVEDRKTKLERLDFMVRSIDMYEKRLIQEDIKDVLLEIAPMIENKYIIREAFDDENADISAITVSLVKKFRTTQELSALAGLVVLSIAARLPYDKSRRLIAQAKQLAYSAKKGN